MTTADPPASTGIDIGVPYELRRSARAKRLQAVVRPGRVEVVVPCWARPRHVREFLRQAEPWIAKRTAALKERSGTILPTHCVSGAEVLFEGAPKTLRLVEARSRHPRVTLTSEIELHVPEGSGEPIARRALELWLRARARTIAEGHIATYAPRLGAAPKGLRIKSQRTLWGSCGPTGMINLNWRLIGAPPAVFEYIVVHELCHLKQRNHGPKFWDMAAELMPDYRLHRAWLRQQGMTLG